MSRQVALITSLAVFCGPGAAVFAAQGRLEQVHSLSCSFAIYSISSWLNGEPKMEGKTSELSLRFDSINIEDGTATVTVLESPQAPLNGGFAPGHIIAKLSLGALHLLQMSDAGPLYVTTVFDAESRPGRLKAVHSRHELISMAMPLYTSTPEQYYGDCKIGS